MCQLYLFKFIVLFPLLFLGLSDFPISVAEWELHKWVFSVCEHFCEIRCQCVHTWSQSTATSWKTSRDSSIYMLSVLLFSMSVSSFDCIFYSLNCLATWWKKSCCSGIWCGARPQTQVGRFQNSRIWALLVAHKLNCPLPDTGECTSWCLEDSRCWIMLSMRYNLSWASQPISCRAWDFPDDRQNWNPCLQREIVHFDWSFILTWKQSVRCVTPGYRITGRNVPWCRIEMSTGKWVGALWAWVGLTSYFQPWRPPRRHRSLVMVVVSC